jgi:hypothetical protein
MKIEFTILRSFCLIYLRKITEKAFEMFDNKDFLVIFDKNVDLLRIVQSNFSYDAKNLKLTFRFDNIENSLIDKLLRNKPKISIKVKIKAKYNSRIFLKLICFKN